MVIHSMSSRYSKHRCKSVKRKCNAGVRLISNQVGISERSEIVEMRERISD